MESRHNMSSVNECKALLIQKAGIHHMPSKANDGDSIRFDDLYLSNRNAHAIRERRGSESGLTGMRELPSTARQHQIQNSD